MRILIISAMADVELNFLIDKLDNKETEVTNLCTFYLGKILNYEIIICDAKIGLINAASATTLAIEKYHPDLIINQGCAGGCGKEIHKSDIVIGTDCINITSMISKYRDIGQGSNIEDWDLINFVLGEEDRLIPQKANQEIINIIKNIEHKYDYGKVHYGRIGSGDIWNKECDRILQLNEKYDVLCEEMEGIAVYTVANQYNIPVVGIRVISDNEILKEEYERGLSIKAQEFTEEILRNFSKNY